VQRNGAAQPCPCLQVAVPEDLVRRVGRHLHLIGGAVAACGRGRASPEKSSPETTLNTRPQYTKSQTTLICSPKLTSPIKLELALSRAPATTPVPAIGRHRRAQLGAGRESLAAERAAPRPEGLVPEPTGVAHNFQADPAA
jgi:hypothetical protein